MEDNGVTNDPDNYSEYMGEPAEPAVPGRLARRGVAEIFPRAAVPAHGSWVERSNTNYMTSPMILDTCAQHHKMTRTEFEEYKRSPYLCPNIDCTAKLYCLPDLLSLKESGEQIQICKHGHKMTKQSYDEYLSGPRRCPVQHCKQQLIENPNSVKAWDRIVSMCSSGHMACDKCYKNFTDGEKRPECQMWFHPRENTVDIDNRFGYTYGELRSIVDRRLSIEIIL